MAMIVPQVTLVLVASCALLNIWLAFRVGQVRGTEKVTLGDGGNERVIRRMRAHANFAENAWIVVALVLAIELSVGATIWLWAAAALFVAVRIAHALGMEGWLPGRAAGTGVTFLVQLVLAIWAVAIPLTVRQGDSGPAIEVVEPQG